MSDASTGLLVGLDMQAVDEVEESLQNFGARYRKRLFTELELVSCGEGTSSAARLAERFAAKEAVLKILDTRETVPPWRSIEVQVAAAGRTRIVLHESAATLARHQGIVDIHATVGYAGGIATAVVVATVSSDCKESKL